MSEGAAPPLVLGSASPRRRRVLEQLGLAFEVVPAADDVEGPWEGEPPDAFARATAVAKARDVRGRRPEATVIAADTIVVVDGDVLGKPLDAADARAMLERLAGRDHRVVTGIAVLAPDRPPAAGVEATDVRFRALEPAVIESYVATGEPLDKAGAYGIQGYGAALVESVRGCYFNVMGLPVARLMALLEEAGLDYAFPGRLEARDVTGATRA